MCCMVDSCSWVRVYLNSIVSYFWESAEVRIAYEQDSPLGCEGPIYPFVTSMFMSGEQCGGCVGGGCYFHVLWLWL